MANSINRFTLYTVGGYFKASGHNQQTPFQVDADLLTFAQAEKLREKMGLWNGDIQEVSPFRLVISPQ